MILLVVGLIVGGAVGVYVGNLLGRREGQERASQSAEEVASAKASLEEVRGQVAAKTNELADARKASAEEVAAVREALESQKIAGAKTNERFEAAREHFAEQRRQIEEMDKRVKESFEALSAAALKSNNEQFVKLADQNMKPLREQLERYEGYIQKLEKARQEAYGGLNKQLTSLETRSDRLGQETSQLVAALRQSGAKGKWGEISLQRIVELSGMTEHCDFDTQTTLESGQRPDLIINLPGERRLAVDSKVNTGAYLDALNTQDEEQRKQLLDKYARDVRYTLKALGAKEYWKQLSPSPEFVVMFMPGEAFFAAAVSQDRDLLVDGIDKHVLLASPMTLIALLLSVQHGWRQQEAAENSEQIIEAGRNLYESLRVFVEHMDAIRGGIEKVTKAFNNAVANLESYTLPRAHKLADLGADTGKDIKELKQADTPMRRLLPEENGGATSGGPTRETDNTE